MSHALTDWCHTTKGGCRLRPRQEDVMYSLYDVDHLASAYLGKFRPDSEITPTVRGFVDWLHAHEELEKGRVLLQAYVDGHQGKEEFPDASA